MTNNEKTELASKIADAAIARYLLAYTKNLEEYTEKYGGSVAPAKAINAAIPELARGIADAVCSILP